MMGLGDGRRRKRGATGINEPRLRKLSRYNDYNSFQDSGPSIYNPLASQFPTTIPLYDTPSRYSSGINVLSNYPNVLPMSSKASFNIGAPAGIPWGTIATIGGLAGLGVAGAAGYRAYTTYQRVQQSSWGGTLKGIVNGIKSDALQGNLSIDSVLKRG